MQITVIVQIALIQGLSERVDSLPLSFVRLVNIHYLQIIFCRFRLKVNRLLEHLDFGSSLFPSMGTVVGLPSGKDLSTPCNQCVSCFVRSIRGI